MAFALFFLLLAIPFIEISLFIIVGHAIGLGPTLALVLASAMLGSFMIRTQGLRTWQKARATLERGEMPVKTLFDGLCLFAGGVLLLIPGFFTDALGLLLLLPPVRWLLAGQLLRRMVVKSADGSAAQAAPIIIETAYHEVTGDPEKHPDRPPPANSPRD